MVDSPWRKHANQVIARVVADNPGLSEMELRKKLSAAYPFGERKYHPYQIWLSAVDEHFNPRPKERKAKARPVAANEGQLSFSMEGDDGS